MGPDSSRSSWRHLAWLPIPLLLAAIIAARAAGLSETYENETLRLVLSFTFYTLVSLGTLFLVGRSFLASGLPGLLLLECGVVLWSLAGTVGDIFDRGDANINVTIFNTGILLAALCHLAGAVLSLRPQRSLHAKPLWLGAGCALALGTLGLITWAALAHWLPVFFIPGQGGTMVRYCVLTVAAAMFVLSAVLLYTGRRGAIPVRLLVLAGPAAAGGGVVRHHDPVVAVECGELAEPHGAVAERVLSAAGRGGRDARVQFAASSLGREVASAALPGRRGRGDGARRGCPATGVPVGDGRTRALCVVLSCRDNCRPLRGPARGPGGDGPVGNTGGLLLD